MLGHAAMVSWRLPLFLVSLLAAHLNSLCCLQVGKKLPRAQNQTDTNFKSRTISLAEQSVATDKAGQAVTTRNLTLKASLRLDSFSRDLLHFTRMTRFDGRWNCQCSSPAAARADRERSVGSALTNRRRWHRLPLLQEVLGQCGHYSERVRRDALQGLAELLAAHPGVSLPQPPPQPGCALACTNSCSAGMHADAVPVVISRAVQCSMQPQRLHARVAVGSACPARVRPPAPHPSFPFQHPSIESSTFMMVVPCR